MKASILAALLVGILIGIASGKWIWAPLAIATNPIPSTGKTDAVGPAPKSHAKGNPPTPEPAQNDESTLNYYAANQSLIEIAVLDHFVERSDVPTDLKELSWATLDSQVVTLYTSIKQLKNNETQRTLFRLLDNADLDKIADKFEKNRKPSIAGMKSAPFVAEAYKFLKDSGWRTLK